MKRRKFLKMTGIAAASMVLPRFTFSMKARHKPNIIFIIVDDMGYADLGCYTTGANGNLCLVG